MHRTLSFWISQIRFSNLFRVYCFGFGICNASAEKVTYDDHVFPIFESKCLNCHNPDKKKGDLDLSTYQGTLAGSSGGKIAQAGDGGSSKLYSVTVHTEEPVMPPEGEKIAKKDADLIRSWIDGGLLENKGSKAKKKPKPEFSLTAVPTGKRPEGPPPMPQDLLLEPVIVAKRATVVNDIDASPWAPLIAVTGQRQVLLYHSDTMALVGVLPFPYGQPETVSFHPSGKYLLAAGGIAGKSGTTVTWDVTTGKVMMTMGKEFDSVLAADIRADMGGVALGGPSRLIKLWDTQEVEQISSIKKHTDWVTALAYSHDGVLLATGDRNNGVQIWEASTGNEFHSLRGHKKAIVDVKWRTDSNLLATASDDGFVIFWDMNQGKEVKKKNVHGAGILAMDYARDGHLVTSGRDHRVKFLKPDLGVKKELPPFDQLITEVAFSHNGKRVFLADWNGKIEVWDREPAKKIGTLNSNPPSIASRIKWLENESKKEVELSKTETDQTKAAEDALKAAKAGFAQKEKAIGDAQKRLAILKKERDEFETTRKRFEEDQKRKEKERQALKSGAKPSGNQVKQTVEERRKLALEQQKLQKQEQAAKQALVSATRETERAREELKKKPDDQNQKNKLAESEKTQQQKQQDVQKFPALFAQLKKRIAAHSSQIKGSKNEGKDLEEKSKRLYEARQALIAQRNAAAKKKQERHKTWVALNGKIPQLKKALKPAREQIIAKEKVWKEAQAKLKKQGLRKVNFEKQLKFWRTAQVNTDRLRALEKATLLQSTKNTPKEQIEAAQKIANDLQQRYQVMKGL